MTDEEFVVKDRRRFTADGEPVEEEAESPEADAPAGESVGAAPEGPGPGDDAPGAVPLPEISFSMFVLSLASSVLMHLGEMPDPYTNQAAANLPLAKQTIDILGMLQEKTKGNTDQEEENLLKGLLYELRMKYVAAVKS